MQITGHTDPRTEAAENAVFAIIRDTEKEEVTERGRGSGVGRGQRG